MRTFIAIELPQDIKDSLSALQDKLKTAPAEVRWVKHENIHLTLKFLGEIDAKQLDKIKLILQEVARDHHEFKTRVSTLGVFPNLNYPRVIWVGLDKNDEPVQKIVQDLEEKIAKLGIAKEKRTFTSHITIGRVKLGKFIAPENQASREFTVHKITLFKSTLTPGGPVYEILQEANLKAA